MRRLGLTAGDALVAVAVAGAVGLSWGWVLGDSGTARIARIHPGDGEVREIRLDADAAYRIGGPLGETRITVRDGRLRFASSPCSARICMNAGWLEHAGAVQACLPNRITVELVDTDGRFDSMVH